MTSLFASPKTLGISDDAAAIGISDPLSDDALATDLSTIKAQSAQQSASYKAMLKRVGTADAPSPEELASAKKDLLAAMKKVRDAEKAEKAKKALGGAPAAASETAAAAAAAAASADDEKGQEVEDERKEQAKKDSSSRSAAAPADALKPVDGANVVLSIDRRYAAFQLLRKPDEAGDANFPPNLHAAVELFGRCEMLGQAKTCKTAVDGFLDFLASGPGPSGPVSMGTACICWECGHVGLPKNLAMCNDRHTIPGHCNNCGERDRTNFVQVRQPDGSVVPWIAKAASAAEAVQEGSAGKLKPNDPCPCGSQKKYKKCCKV